MQIFENIIFHSSLQDFPISEEDEKYNHNILIVSER